MNKSAQKIAFMLLMIVVLAAIFSVTAFAADGAEASSSMDKVNQITDKVAQYSSDIKAQLKELNEKVKGLLGSAAEYLPLVLGVLLLLECFFGYKLLGLQMFLAGGYIGFAVGLIGYTHLLSADILMPEPTKCWCARYPDGVALYGTQKSRARDFCWCICFCETRKLYRPIGRSSGFDCRCGCAFYLLL